MSFIRIIKEIIQAENTDAKMKILKYAGIAVGALTIVVHFFGAMGIIAVPIGMLLAEGNK